MTSSDGFGRQDRPHPGWYPDPQAPPGMSQQRYWDGSAWTPHVAQAAANVRRRPRRVWPALLAGGAGLVVVALVVGVFVGRSGSPTGREASTPEVAASSEAPTTPPSVAPTPTPTPTSELPKPQVMLGKPVSAALARYVRAYKALWKSEGLDVTRPLGSQMRPRSTDLRERFSKLVDVAAVDPGAQDPASNFGALLTAIELEVGVIESLVSELEDCMQVGEAARIACEIEVWEDEGEVTRAAKRVQAAYQLVNLPAVEDSESESVRFDVGVGECFVEGVPFRVVNCNSTHDGEVFAEYEIPNAASSAYPGDEAVADVAWRECKRRFEGYVGVRLRFSELSVSYVYPSPESWAAGERTISCIAALRDSELRESVRGSGR